mmetsp:Transcript_28568/g.67466  ORF Transcript_28568/g.67466 Transcript_28568/m.67466 type:complete len:228 (+) Transcript_28568:331-1014(+)
MDIGHVQLDTADLRHCLESARSHLVQSVLDRGTVVTLHRRTEKNISERPDDLLTHAAVVVLAARVRVLVHAVHVGGQDALSRVRQHALLGDVELLETCFRRLHYDEVGDLGLDTHRSTSPLLRASNALFRSTAQETVVVPHASDGGARPQFLVHLHVSAGQEVVRVHEELGDGARELLWRLHGARLGNVVDGVLARVRRDNERVVAARVRRFSDLAVQQHVHEELGH